METRKYSSPWVLLVILDKSDTIDWEEEPHMNEFIRETWDENYEDLTPYMKEDFPYVESVSLELKGANCIATVTLDPDKAPKDMNIDDEIMSWLEGQYADGFGEGLEQQVAETITDYDYETYTDINEDGDEEEYEEEVEYTVEYFIKLWPSNFSIKRI